MKRSFFPLIVLILATCFASATDAAAANRTKRAPQGVSPVRVVEVDTEANTARFRNFSATTQNITNHWLCSLFAYVQLSSLTVTEGSLNLAPGAEAVVQWTNINDFGRDLGFYLPINSFADFGSASFMLDFVQWGDGGNGREGVAAGIGLWGAGDFLTGPSPYVYNGDGTQNGIDFWSSFGVANIRMIEADTDANTITIRNFGTAALDISEYWLCANLLYDQLTTLPVVSGSLDLAPGAEVVVEWDQVLPSSRDMGLYRPIVTFADFGESEFMADFLQWGSAGNPREGVAVSAGLWTAGDFLVGPSPYTYTGDGTQSGLSFWQTAPNVRMVAIDALANTVKLRNFGGSTASLGEHQLCSQLVYAPLSSLTLLEGSLDLAPGAEVVVQWSLIQSTPRDLGFYAPIGSPADFALPDFILDFVQWGTDGTPRENVAVAKGLWTAGEFLDGPSPYDYIGDGTQNGLAFWTVATPNVRMIAIDTTASTVRLRNFGTAALDITNHQLCSQLVYAAVGTLALVEGQLDVLPGAEVVVQWSQINDLPRDMGFYRPVSSPADFGTADFMLDFLQWGSGGNPREGVAVSAGLWTAGDFLDGPAPYNYIGSGSENGLAFWSVNSLVGAGEVSDGVNLPGQPLLIDKADRGQISLSWSSSCNSGDSDYGVYEGSIGSYPSHESVLCTTGGATSIDVTPAAGSSYYLIVPNNGDREGSYGRDGAGAPRPAGSKVCKAQLVEVCP